MSSKGDLRDIFRQLHDKGWQEELTGKGHYQFRHDTAPGATILLPNKPPGTPHWIDRKYADIARTERQFGLK